MVFFSACICRTLLPEMMLTEIQRNSARVQPQISRTFLLAFRFSRFISN